MSLNIDSEEIIAVLRQFNPWWNGESVPELPQWKRPAFQEMIDWIKSPEINRSLVLSGPRQVGKTTLFRQAIQAVLQSGVLPENVLYATFDHPLLKLIGQEKVLQVWRMFVPPKKENGNPHSSTEYIFFDELQFMEDWATWLKHQTDFFGKHHQKKRRIAVTGSSASLLDKGAESGVGRTLTIRLPTLSFFEYLQIRNEDPLQGEELDCSLQTFRDISPGERYKLSEHSRKLMPFFHEYLIRGGFPECAKMDSIPTIQRLLREDIIDKILKRDMTAMFGVRQVLQLEQLFLYLCLHDGSIVDFSAICEPLDVKRPTVERYLSFFEAAHLLTRLRPFGYGKEVLRARSKFYLADSSIAQAVFLRGMDSLGDPAKLGTLVESVVFKHLQLEAKRFSYWKGKNDREVDFVMENGTEAIPLEIKYRAKAHTTPKDLRGLQEFCKERKPPRAYIITKEPDDIEMISLDTTEIFKIPAPLACYIIGFSPFF